MLDSEYSVASPAIVEVSPNIYPFVFSLTMVEIRLI